MNEREKLTQSIKNLTNVDVIKDYDKTSTLRSQAEKFNDEKLKKALNKSYKRMATGNLDHDNIPRSIMSIHFKDFEKISKSEDSLELTPDDRDHLMRYFGKTTTTQLEPDKVTYFRDDHKVFTLKTSLV
jgi:hypothetical protein